MGSSGKSNEVAGLKVEVADGPEVKAINPGQPVVSNDDYMKAAQAAIARMKRGGHMGGGPYESREELHDRKALRELE